MAEPLLHPDDPRIVALATDTRVESALPQLDINDPEGVADFILEHLGLRTGARSAP